MVDRYLIECAPVRGSYELEQQLSERGEWVRIEDHAAELAAVRAELARERTINTIGCEMSEACCQCQALRARVADLSMMVRRLVRALPTDHVIGGQAMLLLTKHHLEGSPLRATESAGPVNTEVSK
jgi:hypothetical protein